MKYRKRQTHQKRLAPPKLTEEAVVLIRQVAREAKRYKKQHGKKYLPYGMVPRLAAMLEVSQRTITAVIKRERWITAKMRFSHSELKDRIEGRSDDFKNRVISEAVYRASLFALRVRPDEIDFYVMINRPKVPEQSHEERRLEASREWLRKRANG